MTSTPILPTEGVSALTAEIERTKHLVLTPELADRIITALRASHSPRAEEAVASDLIQRLHYMVNNPSAWSEGFDQAASDLFAEAVTALSAAPIQPKQEEGEAVASDWVFDLLPMGTAPSGEEALEPDELNVHEGSWAIVYGTNAKSLGWVDTHATFAHRVYRDRVLSAAPIQPKQEEGKPVNDVCFCDECQGAREHHIPPHAGAVEVKPLEWRQEFGYEAKVSTAAGLYTVNKYAGMEEPFKLEGIGHQARYFVTLDEAKAAAQDDFNQRILSCLNASTAGVVEVTDAIKVACDALRDLEIGFNPPDGVSIRQHTIAKAQALVTASLGRQV